MAKFEELRYVIKVDDQGGFVVEGLDKKVKDAETAFADLEKQMLRSTKANRVNVNELKSLRNALIQSRDSSALTAKEYARFTERIDNVNLKLNEFQVQAKGTTKVNGDMQSSAGLAGAATIELGRVASDAGFGIRGIANNVQQLASLLVTLSVQAGGAGNAFTLIMNQLKGPLGILVAFQALVSVIEVLDRKFKFFQSTTDELAKSLEEASKETTKSNVELLASVDIITTMSKAEVERKQKLDRLTKSVNNSFSANSKYKKELDETIPFIDGNVTAQEALDNAIQNVAEALPDLVDEQGNLKVSNEELIQSVKDYNNQQLIRADIDALIASNAAIFEEERKIREVQRQLDLNKEIGNQERVAEIYKENATIFEKYFDISKEAMEAAGGQGLIMRLFGADENIDFAELFRTQTKTRLDAIVTEADAVRAKVKELLLQLPPDGKKAANDAREEVETIFDDFLERRKGITERLSEAFQEEIVDSQQILIQAKLVELDIEEKFDLQRLKNAGATEEELFILKESYYNKRLRLLQDFNEKALFESTENASKELSDLGKLQQKSQSRLANFFKKQKDLEAKEREDYFKKLKKDIRAASKAIQSVFDDLLSLRRSTTERELALVDARTNEALTKENLSEKQRIKIVEEAEKQKQKINEESIKAEMKLTQAKFAIKAAELAANVATDIAEGTIAIKKGTAKTASAGFPGNIPLLIAYAAQAASIISGMVQAKRQADTALAGLGGSAVSIPTPTADAITSPDFNVVGQSQVSQLSESISGALGEPVKAYVVSTEIADSLAFQRKIDRQSGFGAGGFGAGS